MVGNLRSAAIAGVIAAVIYAIFGFIFDNGSVVLWAIVLGVFTFVVTFAVSSLISARHRR